MNTGHSHTSLIVVLCVVVALFAYAFLMFYLEIRSNKLKQRARELIPGLLQYGWVDGQNLLGKLHRSEVGIKGTALYYLMAELVGEGVVECEKRLLTDTSDSPENESENITNEDIKTRRYRLIKNR